MDTRALLEVARQLRLALELPRRLPQRRVEADPALTCPHEPDRNGGEQLPFFRQCSGER